MKRNLSLDGKNYLNSNVRDLLLFLNRKINSKKKEIGSCDIYHGCDTTLSSLFDNIDTLTFYNYEDWRNKTILQLNDKLLVISFVTEDIDCLISHFVFELYPNVSDFILETGKNNKNNTTSLVLTNRKDIKLNFPSVTKLNIDLPKEIPVTTLLKPTSFDELYEIGRIKKSNGKAPKQILYR